MTSRRGGAIAIILGVVATGWAWFGVWPLTAPVFGRGTDYVGVGLHGLSFTIAIAGVLCSILGVFLLFAGRGGPDQWGQR